MAFKIRNFYTNSPLHNHHDKNKVVKDPKGDPVTIVKGNQSPNRDLTEGEIRRRKKKLEKLKILIKLNLQQKKQKLRKKQKPILKIRKNHKSLIFILLIL